jgi:vesicle-fusing ATPase
MDLRNNLFGKPAARGGGNPGPGPGLPGRQQQRPPPGSTGGAPAGYPPAPSGYDSYGGRSPAPAPGRPQNPGAGGGYGGGYDAPPQHQSRPRSRQVPLRLAKVDDKTTQAQYIFGNV